MIYWVKQSWASQQVVDTRRCILRSIARAELHRSIGAEVDAALSSHKHWIRRDDEGMVKDAD